MTITAGKSAGAGAVTTYERVNSFALETTSATGLPRQSWVNYVLGKCWDIRPILRLDWDTKSNNTTSFT